MDPLHGFGFIDRGIAFQEDAPESVYLGDVPVLARVSWLSLVSGTFTVLWRIAEGKCRLDECGMGQGLWKVA